MKAMLLTMVFVLAFSVEVFAAKAKDANEPNKPDVNKPAKKVCVLNSVESFATKAKGHVKDLNEPNKPDANKPHKPHANKPEKKASLELFGAGCKDKSVKEPNCPDANKPAKKSAQLFADAGAKEKGVKEPNKPDANKPVKKSCIC